MPTHRHARPLAVVAAAALTLASCTSEEAGSSAPDGEVDASVQTYGGIERIGATDLPPTTEVSLHRPDGEQSEATTDELGSVVFRDLEPGDGYRVGFSVDGEERQSEPITVLDEADTPDQSFFDEQQMEQGLNYITMRDGVELAATVRLPEGKTLADGPFPTLIEYSGYETAAPGDALASIAAQLSDPESEGDPLAPSTSTAVGSIVAPLLGFAVVSVQIRGSGCSGGDFDMFGLPSIYDGYDAVEIVGAQPWVKGSKVGMVGISYSGYSQLYVGGTQPPSLAALAPMSVLSDLYVGIGSPGGIRNTGFAEGWLEGRQSDAEPAPEGGQEWAKILVADGDEHCIENQKQRLQTLNVLDIVEGNEFKAPALYERRIPADWAENIDVPVFLVGGTQDEQLGSDWLNVVERIDNDDQTWVTLYNGFHNDALAPEILTRWAEFLYLFVAEDVPEIPDNVLGLAGALYEQSGGADAPPVEQSRFAGTTDFDKALATFEEDARVRVLAEFGAGELGPRSLESSEELAFDTWPPSEAEATTWYLGDDGALVPNLDDAGSGSDDYRSDPSQRPETNLGDGGVYDAEPDFNWKPVADGAGLGYVTEPLTEPMLAAGPASLNLSIASSDTDADLQVTLSEVRPDGRETYVSSGWLRASHRALDEEHTTEIRPAQTHLADDAQPLEPGEPVDVRVPIHPFVQQFRTGSSLRVTVQAPGGDVPLWMFATGEDGTRTITVGYGAEAPSALVLPVVTGTDPSGPLPACGALRGQPCRAYVPASNGG
ncbi:MAG: CocE/NonD family hydrolase [Microthrixaceae bacterium]